MSGIAGTWTITISAFIGKQDATLDLAVDGTKVTGTASTPDGSITLREGTLDGDTVTIPIELTQPMAISAVAHLTFSGDTVKGKVSGAPIPGVRITGRRA